MLRRKPLPSISEQVAGYSTAEVSRLTGATMRQLQWWDERGILQVKQDGHSRIYEPVQVIMVRAIMLLRQAGLSLQMIRRIVKHLEFDRMVIDRVGRVRHFQTPEQALEYLRNRPEFLMLLDLSTAEKDLSSGLRPAHSLLPRRQAARAGRAESRSPATTGGVVVSQGKSGGIA